MNIKRNGIVRLSALSMYLSELFINDITNLTVQASLTTVQRMLDELTKGKWLSDKQLKTINEMWGQYSMADRITFK